MSRLITKPTFVQPKQLEMGDSSPSSQHGMSSADVGVRLAKQNGAGPADLRTGRLEQKFESITSVGPNGARHAISVEAGEDVIWKDLPLVKEEEQLPTVYPDVFSAHPRWYIKLNNAWILYRFRRAVLSLLKSNSEAKWLEAVEMVSHRELRRHFRFLLSEKTTEWDKKSLKVLIRKISDMLFRVPIPSRKIHIVGVSNDNTQQIKRERLYYESKLSALINLLEACDYSLGSDDDGDLLGRVLVSTAHITNFPGMDVSSRAFALRKKCIQKLIESGNSQYFEDAFQVIAKAHQEIYLDRQFTSRNIFGQMDRLNVLELLFLKLLVEIPAPDHFQIEGRLETHYGEYMKKLYLRLREKPVYKNAQRKWRGEEEDWEKSDVSDQDLQGLRTNKVESYTAKDPQGETEKPRVLLLLSQGEVFVPGSTADLMMQIMRICQFVVNEFDDKGMNVADDPAKNLALPLQAFLDLEKLIETLHGHVDYQDLEFLNSDRFWNASADEKAEALLKATYLMSEIKDERKLAEACVTIETTIETLFRSSPTFFFHPQAKAKMLFDYIVAGSHHPEPFVQTKMRDLAAIIQRKLHPALKGHVAKSPIVVQENRAVTVKDVQSF